MNGYRWLVVNQSQSAMFQAMLVRLVDRLGPCVLITGTPYPHNCTNLKIIAGPQYNRTSKRSRLLSWARFLSFASVQIIKYHREVSFIWSVTNPPMLPHLVWLLTRRSKVKTAILIWDLYPEHLVQQGWVKEQGVVVRGWTKLNRSVLSTADIVITIGNRMANAISQQMDDPLFRVKVVPNWADTEWLRPLSKCDNPFAIEHGLASKTTVIYSGNIGGSHSVDVLINVAKLFSADDRVRFVIIGDGLGADALDQKIETYQLNNVIRLPLQPWEKLPQSLACGDIAVVSQNAQSAELSVPSKTYSSMAVGSAILALTGPQSDLAELVSDNDIGGVCSPDNPKEIASMIRDWINSPQRLNKKRENSRNLSVKHYSENPTEQHLHKLFHNLIQ